jgi:hypothetical protein
MPAEILLSRLDKVRQVAPRRWLACCPAHDDGSPSLSIRERDDGTVLWHCFAGCSGSDVLAATGLSVAELHGRMLTHRGEKARGSTHWHASREALRSLYYEVLLVAVAAENIAKGVVFDDADRARIVEAAKKIRSIAELCT